MAVTGIRRNIETIEETDPLYAMVEAAIVAHEVTSLFLESGGEFYITSPIETGTMQIIVTPQTEFSKRGMVSTLTYTLLLDKMDEESVGVVVGLIYTHIEAIQSAGK